MSSSKRRGKRRGVFPTGLCEKCSPPPSISSTGRQRLHDICNASRLPTAVGASNGSGTRLVLFQGVQGSIKGRARLGTSIGRPLLGAVAGILGGCARRGQSRAGTQFCKFTSFTGTNVQILTKAECLRQKAFNPMWSDAVRTKAKSPSPPPQEREGGGGVTLWGGELVPHLIQNTHTHTQGCAEIPAFKPALKSVSRYRTSPSSSTQAARSWRDPNPGGRQEWHTLRDRDVSASRLSSAPCRQIAPQCTCLSKEASRQTRMEMELERPCSPCRRCPPRATRPLYPHTLEPCQAPANQMDEFQGSLVQGSVMIFPCSLFSAPSSIDQATNARKGSGHTQSCYADENVNMDSMVDHARSEARSPPGTLLCADMFEIGGRFVSVTRERCTETSWSPQIRSHFRTTPNTRASERHRILQPFQRRNESAELKKNEPDFLQRK